MKRNSPISWTGFAPPLRVELRSSPRLGAFYLAVHGTAALAVLAAALPWVVRAPLIAAVGVSLARIWRRHVRRTHPRAVRALQLRGDGAVGLEFTGGDRWDTVTVERAFVHPLIVLLTVRSHERLRDTVVVPGDALNPDAFHRLRVSLRSHRER